MGLDLPAVAKKVISVVEQVAEALPQEETEEEKALDQQIADNQAQIAVETKELAKVSAGVTDSEAVIALKLAASITKQQNDVIAEVQAKAADQLKQKDVELVKVGSIMFSALSGIAIVQDLENGVSWMSVGLTLLMFGLSFVLTIGIQWVKNKYPTILPTVKTMTDTITPLLDPKLKQGIKAVGQVIEQASNQGQDPNCGGK